MDGRWEVLLTAAGTLKGAQDPRTPVHGDGWEIVPVVPCDEAAIERAVFALSELLAAGLPSSLEYELVAKTVLGAAGETNG